MENNRRPLTDEQKRAADRLKVLYQNAKEEARLRNKKVTHEQVAEAHDWQTVNVVSQYINGKIPLNLEAACKFATFLGVGVGDICPDLERMLPPENRRPKKDCPLCDEEVDLSARQLDLLAKLVKEMAPKKELSWRTI